MPLMEKDLGATQSLMSGTVQMNILLKGVVGVTTAALSDHVGRKPVLLTCNAPQSEGLGSY